MKDDESNAIYDNLDRDIFFTTIIKDNKGRPDFDDTAKCMVWEENRTRYYMDSNWRVLVDYSKNVRKVFDTLMKHAELPEQKEQVKLVWNHYLKEEIIPNFSPLDLTKVQYYWGNFPYNELSWPEKPYLSHPPKKRNTWKYDPFLDRKKYESLYFKSIGDKELKSYPEGDGQKVTMKVPVTIEVDPLYDETNLKRVLMDNVQEVMEMAEQKRAEMEKEGYLFRKEQPKDERPRSWYETGLRYLGHYRLYKCERWEYHKVEEAFNKGWEKKKARPIEKETFMKKVKKELPYLPW
jgi:hypothetical protein